MTLYFLRVGGVLLARVVLNASIEGAHVLSQTEITPNIICASTLFAKSLFFAHFKVLLIINLLNNYAHLMCLCNKCCIGTYYM